MADADSAAPGRYGTALARVDAASRARERRHSRGARRSRYVPAPADLDSSGTGSALV
jgi:hypothetical protein